MAFRVGQEVVCVDDSPGEFTGERHLVANKVYTIDGITKIGGLYLQGVPKTHLHSWGEPKGWRPDRFRPVKTTDISIFTAMLNPSKQTVDAP